MTLSGDGTVRYDPNGRFETLAAGETALDAFRYTVDAGNGVTATAAVTVRVVGANDIPMAGDDTVSTNEDKTVIIAADALIANDADPDQSDRLRIVDLDVHGALGVVTRNADGGITYDPSGRFDALTVGQTAIDRFCYTVDDGHGGADTATVRVVIAGRNDAPNANADIATTEERSPITLAAALLLANDSDPDAGDALRIVGVDGRATAGAVRLNGDGTITYNPSGRFDALRAGETATDSFLYTVADGKGGTARANVTVTVVGREDPAAQPGELVAGFEEPLAGGLPPEWNHAGAVSVVSGYNEPGPGILGPTTPQGVVRPFAPTEGAQMSLLEAFEIPRVKLEEFLGLPCFGLPRDVDPDRSKPMDGSEPTDGAAMWTELLVKPGDVLSFDWMFDARDSVLPLAQQTQFNDYAVVTISDPETSQFRVIKLSDVRETGDYGASGWRTSVYDLTRDLNIGPDGKSLILGFAVLNDQRVDIPGRPSPFDSRLLVDNVRLNRDLGDDHALAPGQKEEPFQTWIRRPLANDDALTVNEHTPRTVVGDVLANDAAADPLDPNPQLTLVDVDSSHTVGKAIWENGAVTYDPAGRFEFLGADETATDSFRYTVSDNRGVQDTATITVTVTGMNDAPAANADAASATEKNTVAGAVLSNDADPDANDTLMVATIDSTETLGAVAFDGGRMVVYDPNGRFDWLAAGETTADSFRYTVVDRHGLSDAALVSVTVMGVNDAPTARDDTATTDFDRPLTVSANRLLANDSDPDRADTLRMTTVDATGTLGAVRINSDGTLSYDPNGRFDWLGIGETAIDRFAYTVSDDHGGFATAAVTVTVTNINDPPAARDDAVATDEDFGVRIAAARMLANDADADSKDTLRVTALDDSQTLGRVTFDAHGDVSYDPSGRFEFLAVGEAATDRFRYLASDSHGESHAATVTITVAGVNDAPTAADDAATTDEDTPLTLSTGGLLANDRDVDTSDRLTVTAINTRDTVGRVALNEDGTLTYDPRGRFDGLGVGETATDTFTYTVEDGKGGVDTASVRVTVAGLNDVPPRIERLLESFESGVGSQNRLGSIDSRGCFDEPDGLHGVYRPTDGGLAAFLEAYGATRPQIERFLGLPVLSKPPFALPNDVDESAAAIGSALKLSVAVTAGDAVSFDWMFDGGDQLPDNGFAVFTVSGSRGSAVFKLSDVRQIGDSASGWRSSVYTAEANDQLIIGFSVVNDRAGHPKGSFEASRLLIDNVRLNRDFGEGCQVVDTQEHGIFQTVVHS